MAKIMDCRSRQLWRVRGGVGDKVSNMFWALWLVHQWECGVVLFVWLFAHTLLISCSYQPFISRKPPLLSAFLLQLGP